MSFDTITKEQFLAAYNKHLPNGWTKLAFRYFSKDVAPKDAYVKKIFQGILIGLFLIGLIGTILNLNNTLIGIPTITFTVLLFLFGIFMFGAFIMNNLRIRKIRKELGVTAQEYNILVGMFMD